MNKIPVAKSGEVREGQTHVVQADGQAAILTRVAGKVCAIANRCPHLGLPLARGKIVDGTIRCPWHGSSFDLCSGRNLDWANAFAGIPMPAWSHGLLALGRKPAPVRRYETTEEAGSVFITLPS